METVNRVIKNTGLLYVKMIISMIISLYTTRIVLMVLGPVDYGIYSVVGGAISMFGFLNAAMATATQRYMSYFNGSEFFVKQCQVFNISMYIHVFIALIITCVLLVFQCFWFDDIFNIPVERILAAKQVFLCLIIGASFTIVTVPYEALLNARENVVFFSIYGIIESFIKLIIAILITYNFEDKLLFFSALSAVLPVVNFFAMRFYCLSKYSESRINIKKHYDKKLLLELTGFASWNFLEMATAMISQYGLAIVLNNFFGSILNAAMGVANQISGQLSVLSNTLMKSVIPVINKSEGEGNRKKMLDTAKIGTKYSFYLLVILCVPFIVETPLLLKLWLNIVPEWAILFVRLQLLRSILEQLTVLYSITITAVGEIKNYKLIRSILNASPIVMTIVLFKLNYPPYSMYVVWILSGGFLVGFLNILFNKIKCGLEWHDYLTGVLFPCFLITLVTLAAGIAPTFFLAESLFRLFMVVLAVLLSFISMFRILLTEEEVNYFSYLIRQLKENFNKKKK